MTVTVHFHLVQCSKQILPKVLSLGIPLRTIIVFHSKRSTKNLVYSRNGSVWKNSTPFHL